MVVGEKEGKESLPTVELRRLSSDCEMPQIPMDVEWTAAEEGREEEQIEFTWVGEAARIIGTVAHRWLHRIANDQSTVWLAGRADSLSTTFLAELERLGISESEIEIAGILVKRSLLNAVSGERGQWVLGDHSTRTW